jgi:hypothetical protein
VCEWTVDVAGEIESPDDDMAIAVINLAERQKIQTESRKCSFPNPIDLLNSLFSVKVFLFGVALTRQARK